MLGQPLLCLSLSGQIYVHYSEIVSLLDHVYRLADAGVSYVWQEDHLACFPSYRFCDAVYGISSVLDDKYIFCGAADAIGDECPHIIDIHL